MRKIKILFGFVLLLGLASCTDDFKEINTNPNGITSDEASAKYFITGPQVNLYAANRYPYWRAQLIHTDRYAGYFTFGHSGNWWSDNLSYSFSGGYTDASWDWIEGNLGGLDNFMKLTDTGGEFENELMYATGLIMKGLYYQMFTDTWGEVPYSEAADPDVVLPRFDTQKDIYKGIIADLDRAMTIIGDAVTSGDGVQDLGANDLYCGGDMQKWKKLANTLKLRIAIRAHGASGDDFSAATVTSALASDLLETESDNVLLDKDAVISQWGSATYGDIWHNFGGLGSKWSVSESVINYLQDYDDPRLSYYAQPVAGGTFGFKQPEVGTDPEPHDYFFERVEHIRDKIAHVVGNTDFYTVQEPDSVTFILPENTYYIGQPTRFDGGTRNYVKWEFFSKPAEVVTQQKNQGPKPFNELILTTGESYFLRAQAAVLGLSGENAQEMYEEGIRQEMKLWGVGDDDINNFIDNSAMGDITTGTQDQQLEKIAIQRWLSKYTDGFEGWAIVRKSGYPSELADGVTNNHIYYIGGSLGEMYPQRMRYGSRTYSTNGSSTSAANARQGADLQSTELWYTK